MKKQELVHGDAYIVSRTWKPITCNWCSNITTTSIRVPSLNLYLAWCEKCQKVPNNAWYLPSKELPGFKNDNAVITTFESSVNEYNFTGCNLQDAKKCAIDETRKNKYEVSISYLNYLDKLYNNYFYEKQEDSYSPEYPQNITSSLDSIAIDNTELLSNIFDLNTILQDILCVINDQEREILILIIHRYTLDNYLTNYTKEKLYQGFDLEASDQVKITQKGVAEFLGYRDTTAFIKYKQTIGSLINKTRKVLLYSGFKKEIESLDNNPDTLISCLRGF